MTTEKIRQIISQMTLEEKASMCSGKDFWHTEDIPRLGIPSTMVADGPHGIRKHNMEKENASVHESIPSIGFPTACAQAASFNREQIALMGKTIGHECQAEDISIILGPGVNIKRSPVCGRNFEYYSEDPYLATEMAGSLVSGIQSQNVGACLKHFFANNQETRRSSVSSNMDERTMHEIYLAAFEGAVRKHKPWSIMSSYNLVNGQHTTASKEILNDLLRKKWGFDGYVMSDWGAVFDRVTEAAAGMDLEMPTSNGENDKLLVAAVQNGTLEESVLDDIVERILRIVFRYHENHDANAVWDMDADHEIARQIAQETMVLLKNEDILPLSSDKQIAFIGKYAKKPRYQGGGSSHIYSRKITSALDAVKEYGDVTYAQGFDDADDAIDETMQAEAVAAAKDADVAVLFVGLPDLIESEAFDRDDMKMPLNQNALIEAVTAVQPNTVIVLHNGSPIEMPWLSKVKGVLEAYLSGEAAGGAIVDILFGKVNPSGKLPETFPLKLEDNPSYLFFPGEGNVSCYNEGIYVGYRYYDKKKMEVLFPFGYGLSYTTFAYSNLQLDKTELKDTDTLTVSVDVTNTGAVTGKEVVQLYVSDPESFVGRPVKELRDFAKVELAPGETKTVTFTLDKQAFAYYNTVIHDWHVETGEFIIMVGKSSREIELEASVTVYSTVKIPMTYTVDTPMCDIMRDEGAYEITKGYLHVDNLYVNDESQAAAMEAITPKMQDATFYYMPLRAMLSYGDGKMTVADLHELVDKLNAYAGQ